MAVVSINTKLIFILHVKLYLYFICVFFLLFLISNELSTS